ncbi:anaphase-promoting complex subunit 2-like isoform X2 [Beta vulgaris subsp. vulgaris]|uniref:anaphase-promoting complex subunit 2-like isoform X2 n=1 Tax=Beta vulgaris subsp. vulgaris TaxID=3555 RepID=UPI002036B8B4|nr:anaphase-promoting complex subunit 2-like isoform X2 [Beta vulgaris subsp. vulgaris]XP_048495086.1 anaphase-promoting complex subunit 2-like isoform X2 [Beta vulgaris subsp. vulgaris]
MLKSLLRLEDHRLCDYGLRSLVEDHFLQSLEVTFETTGASRFWKHFDAYVGGSISMNEESRLEESLYRALAEMSLVKQCQDRSLLMLVHSLQSHRDVTWQLDLEDDEVSALLLPISFARTLVSSEQIGL